MNVASLELCKELYELSGWGDTYLRWANFKEPRVVNADEWAKNMEGEPDLIASGDSVYVDQTVLTPAYSLGYLMRALPKATQLTKRSPSNYQRGDKDWLIRINFGSKTDLDRDYINRFYIQADTPEDAACKLAIELFKQGVLKKDKS